MPRVLRASMLLVVLALIGASCAGERPSLVQELFIEELPEDEQQAVARPTAVAPATQPTVENAPPSPTAGTDTDTGTGTDTDVATPTPLPPGTVEDLWPHIEARYPHDPDAFTQGLLIDDGQFVESTGLRGESDLRRVDIETGEIIDIVPVPDDTLFAEGLALVGDEYIQLTWTSGRALWWSRDFQLLREVTYEGQGWGLCHDGSRLVMSDGSATLTFRDPVSFDAIGSVDVSLDDEPVTRLNELECVNGAVWANVWQTDQIVRIDPDSGAVTGSVDASGLWAPDTQPPPGSDVLNGIAWDEASQTFLITGKDWPNMFRVRFLPQPPN